MLDNSGQNHPPCRVMVTGEAAEGDEFDDMKVVMMMMMTTTTTKMRMKKRTTRMMMKMKKRRSAERRRVPKHKPEEVNRENVLQSASSNSLCCANDS
ncbi:hypothetical protein P3S67_030643 [Capsicum chacoense]